MRVLTYPDPFLRTVAKPVEKLTPEILERIEEMCRLMRETGGVGLAATQVGWDARIFVMNEHPDEVSHGRKGAFDMTWINPVVEPLGKGSDSKYVSLEPLMVAVDEGEGCLSVPGTTRRILRARHVKVTGMALARADSGPNAWKLCRMSGDTRKDNEDDAIGRWEPWVGDHVISWEFQDLYQWDVEPTPRFRQVRPRIGPFVVQHEVDHLNGILIVDHEEAP